MAPTARFPGTMPSFSARARLLLAAVLALAVAGCASHPLETFKDGQPVFQPEKFFAGRTHSWGVFETRGGDPTRILYTKTEGRWDGSILHFEQDLIFPKGKTTHRSWLIRRLDAQHYSATGTGIVGTAHGVVSGNAFHLDFTLDALPGNPLGHLHMSQWMYLQPDGVSMVNRDTLTKAGVIVTEITELFHKDR